MASSPITISLHRYRPILSHIWHEVNSRKGIITIAICGKRGSGKSWIMLLLMWLLDRDANDKSHFSIEKVSFKASEFLEWLNKPKKEWRKGSVIGLDDAGLHMYNRDSLTNFIKVINKTLQNIRYKHPIVILTLPSFQMLDKHARDMTDIYIEVVGRDSEAKENLCKIHEIYVTPFDATLLRPNITTKKTVIHPTLKCKIVHTRVIQYRFETPTSWIVEEYEERKERYLDEYNIKNINALKREEQKIDFSGKDMRQKISFPDAVKYCQERIHKFLDKNNKIDRVKLMLEVDEQGRQLFGLEQSRMLSKALEVKKDND